MKSNKPLSRKKDLVTQETDGEIMIYDLNTNKAFCLNETSALVWEMCDGNNSVSEISEGVAKKLNSPANEDLVWLALDQLKKEKLIANSEELESKFEGMSRRDVIKKVGLGTMIALPIVAGMTAPSALHAASTCTPVALGCMCSNSGPVGSLCTSNGTVQAACANAACACYHASASNTNGNCAPPPAP